jgi:hypothetical protein
VTEGGPELADGRTEGGGLGLREQRHCRARETLLGGTEAVEERGDADLDENPPKGTRAYTGGGDKRCPGDALGSQTHGPDGYTSPIGDADEGDRLVQPDFVQDVLHPEGVPVSLGRGAGLSTKAGLAHDVGCVDAMALRQRQEPCQAGGVQGVPAR